MQNVQISIVASAISRQHHCLEFVQKIFLPLKPLLVCVFLFSGALANLFWIDWIFRSKSSILPQTATRATGYLVRHFSLKVLAVLSWNATIQSKKLVVQIFLGIIRLRCYLVLEVCTHLFGFVWRWYSGTVANSETETSLKKHIIYTTAPWWAYWRFNRINSNNNLPMSIWWTGIRFCCSDRWNRFTVSHCVATEASL